MVADIEGGTHRLRVSDKRVLRRTFGPKRDGVTGECRKLHNEDLNSLYSSPNIVLVIKSRRMNGRGMWHVWRKGEVCTRFRLGNLRERYHWEDKDVDGRIILRWIFGSGKGLWGLDG